MRRLPGLTRKLPGLNGGSFLRKPAGTIELSAAIVDDDANAGDTIGSLSVVGAGAGPWTYSLTDDAAGMFALAGDSLVTGLNPLNHDTAPSPTVTVKASEADDRYWFFATRNKMPSGALVAAVEGTQAKASLFYFGNADYVNRTFRFHFSGFAGSESGTSPAESILPGNATVIHKVFLIVDGALHQLKFGGNDGVTIASDTKGAWTDAFTLPGGLPRKAKFGIATVYSTAVGENQIPVMRIQSHRGERIWGAATAAEAEAFLADLIQPSTASLDLDTQRGAIAQPCYYGPDFMVAKGDWDGRPILLSTADSITESRQEISVSADDRGNMGWWRRYLDGGKSIPHLIIGYAGAASFRELTGTGSTRATYRWDILDEIIAFNGGKWPFTIAANAMGYNDTAAIETYLSRVQGLYTRMRARYAGIKILQVIPSGRCTSTDRYLTTSNQTFEGSNIWPNGNKWQFRDAVIANTGNWHDGYIDTFAAWSDPIALGKWPEPSTEIAFNVIEAVGDGTASWYVCKTDAPAEPGQYYAHPTITGFTVAYCTANGDGTYAVGITGSVAAIPAETPFRIAPTHDGVHPSLWAAKRWAAMMPQDDKSKLGGRAVQTFFAEFTVNVRRPLPALPMAIGARVMYVGDSQEGFNNGQNNAMVGVLAAQNFEFGPLTWLRAFDPHINIDNWYDANDPWHRNKSTPDGTGGGIQGANQGIFGDHIDWDKPEWGDGILNRLDYVLSLSPEIIILQGGTNSLSSGDVIGQSTPASGEYVIAKWEQMLQKCRNEGVPVVLRVILPRGGGAGDWALDDLRIAELIKVRDWQREQEGRDGVVALWDDWDIIADGNGQWLAGMSDDKVHLSVKGAKTVAAATGAQKIKTILEDNVGAGSVFDQDPTVSNLLGSSMGNLTGSTGSKVGAGTTGSVATGFSLRMIRGVSTQVASKETISGTLTRQVVSITPVADALNYHWSDFYLSAGLSTGLPAEGTWVRAYMYVEVPAVVGMKLGMVNLYAAARAGSNILAQSYGHQANSSVYLQDNINGDGFWVMTEPFMIPAGLSFDNLYLYARAAFAMDSAPFVIKYSRPIIRSIADPRPAWGY